MIEQYQLSHRQRTNLSRKKRLLWSNHLHPNLTLNLNLLRNVKLMTKGSKSLKHLVLTSFKD